MEHLYRRIIAVGMIFLGTTVAFGWSQPVEWITLTFNWPDFAGILGVMLIFCGVLAAIRPQTWLYIALSLPGFIYLGSLALYFQATTNGAPSIVLMCTLYSIWVIEAVTEKSNAKGNNP